MLRCVASLSRLCPQLTSAQPSSSLCQQTLVTEHTCEVGWPACNTRPAPIQTSFLAPLSFSLPLLSPATTSLNTTPQTTQTPPSKDLLPVPESARNFKALDFAALWVTLVISITTYYLAASLVDMGMAWWQVCVVKCVGAAKGCMTCGL